ncbi:MAG: hypothetical protein NVSMB38_41210 [Ktedonobacteraceae bacterium]
MARHFRPQSTPGENVRIVARSIPWKLLLFIPILVVLAVPAYLFASNAGKNIVPGVTSFFYGLSAPPSPPAPTPQPAFPRVLPQAGSLLYTVQGGDSCDSILAYQMRMTNAGQVFSDVNPNTVKALNASLGQDCHALQPGMVLPLSPQYPLIAFGGVVLKIDATSPQQVLPTPLIRTSNQQLPADCTGGCLLTVRLASQVQVHLLVQTTLVIKVGSWVWTQAMLARKNVQGFPNYPYADPKATLDGMSLRACDLQIDDTHDDNSLSCDQLMPNSIDDDRGVWLLSVTGADALDHWHYGVHLPAGTRVLLWLSSENGVLKFHKGNPLYKYDEGSHVYVKV